MTEVILVTGFLGTGKTSLINAWLHQIDTRLTGVVVNEAGDTQIDSALTAEAAGDGSAIRTLENGCLCCAARDDLAVAIRALVDQHIARTGVPSERIIVEASGLAVPGRLLQQLRTLPDMAVRVVATVDAARIADPRTHPEIAGQWAAADTLVLTRTDGEAATDHGAAAMRSATDINPLAARVVVTDRSQRASAAFARTSPGDRPIHAMPADDRHAGVGVFTLAQSAPSDWERCAEWFDNLLGLAGDRLLRVKAIVDVTDEACGWLVQAVGTAFARPQPLASAGRGHAVVIVRDLDAAAIATVAPVGLFTLLPYSEVADV